MRNHTLAVLGALVFGLSTASGFQAGKGNEAHTRVRLLADVRSIRPGVPFTVGVLLSMDPGWHTYWKNSGESGLATQVQWTLPRGFMAGEPLWPIPEKKIEGGDVLSYGYGTETMLLVPITPPAISPGSAIAKLVADVSWLECKNTCVPGSARVELTLPVLDEAQLLDNEVLFSTYRRRIPGPWSEAAGFVLTHDLSHKSLGIRLTTTGASRFVVSKDDAPDFYPEPLDLVTIGRTQVIASPTSATLTVPLSALQGVDGPLTLRGVVVTHQEPGGRRGVRTEILLPADFCRSLAHTREEQPIQSLFDREFDTGQGTAGRQPFLLYLLFAVIGGLLLNIMPCVLPVIALKVFGLVRMAGDNPRKVKRLGWSFSLGILASFLTLAVLVILLQLAGQQVGWGFQFQEPLFVIAMSAVVFAFGLSLFGVYEIRLPGSAISGVGNVLAKQDLGRGGYGASFWEGVFATILATPCTAPFLGSALGFAFSQPWWVILLIFVCVAAGMALPYLILTSKPAWLKFLPKPGEWMETAKQFMGFLMMATLLWLLYVLGKQLGMEGVIWTGAFLLMVGIACWLIGRFATLRASRTKVATTWAIAVALVALGYWGFLDSVLDVRGLIGGAPGAAQVEEQKKVLWQPFSLSQLESALAEEKPVFLDFTAEWCLTCKLNEKTVLADASVAERLRSSGMLAMKADWTNRNPEITRLLAKFGRSGVPLYVVFPAGRPNQPIVLPEVITAGMVIEAIERGVGS